ncbi:hypothetical protein CEXT_472741 [Caerostris extrusa]|uniref:Uncharacterized protein n=1 Tax=Caerostris extrusa TaxID=172846 RepID=A0AAV4XB47_CAEEX|nr:hypothetical protein CEXT_472741 [Caerostris extrusa]
MRKPNKSAPVPNQESPESYCSKFNSVRPCAPAKAKPDPSELSPRADNLSGWLSPFESSHWKGGRGGDQVVPPPFPPFERATWNGGVAKRGQVTVLCRARERKYGKLPAITFLHLPPLNTPEEEERGGIAYHQALVRSLTIRKVKIVNQGHILCHLLLGPKSAPLISPPTITIGDEKAKSEGQSSGGGGGGLSDGDSKMSKRF